MARRQTKDNARLAIARYFDCARLYPLYADSYMRQALRVSLKYKVAFTKEQKALFSKVGTRYLTADTVRVRVRRNRVIRTDLVSKTFRRVPIR